MSINGSVILKAALQVRLCILLLMIFSSPEIYSQRVDSLQVHFCIVSDTSDAPVVTNTIRVFSSQRHYLIAYQNNSNNACFLQTIAVLEQDTLQITVTAPGYQRLTTSLIPPYSKSISTIRLKGDRSLLPGVVVISSPSWIRGDTTFFRAGFFSQGEEQKLKDLIVKMPGFEITEGGDLLYNKARIEKIMIDGEELYADRVKLLLASFPVHVLKNIQVLENQSSSSLLKGLVNGNRTFVNLELKDDARARIFGDVAAGAGLSDRYLLDMTSFLVRGKVKIAFLANNNSTGTGVDWGEAIEQGNSTAPGFHEWLMTTRYLHTVNNFSSSRYIRNKKLDNRLQFNSSTGKNSRITTQAAVISDWQRQASFFNSRLLDGSSYLARSDSNNMTYRPFEAFINTTYTTNIREKQELKLDLGYLHNVSRGIQDTRYQEESTNYESNNSIRSTTGTLTAGIEYANRQLEDRALRLFGNFVNWNMRQDAVGRSPVWSDIFNVSDPGYNSLLQRLTNHAKISKLGAEKLIKTGKGTVSQSLTGEFQNFTIKSDVQLTDEGIRLPIIPLDQLQNTGLYRSFKILGQTNSTFRIQTLPLLVNIRYGLNYNYGSESSSRATQALPVYDLLISQRRAIRGLVHNYSVRLKQEAINLSFWNRQYYPVSIGSFRANRGGNGTFRNLTTSYSIAFTPIKRMSTYSHVSYERSFSDFFSSYQIDRVLQIINDTSLAQGRNNLRFSLNNNVTLKNARLSAGGQIDQTEGLILSGGIPAIFKSVAWLLRSTLDASFGKGYFLKINAEHHRSNNRYPEQLAGKGSAGSSRSRASVEQRAVIDKVLILTARTEWSRFIMQGRGRGSLFFVDFEVNYKIRNSKWAIRAVGGNLSDERSYYSGYSSALSQTYFEIPLVPRNVFFSVRCEF